MEVCEYRKLNGSTGTMENRDTCYVMLKWSWVSKHMALDIVLCKRTKKKKRKWEL